jgi:hypothetical protein
VVEVREHDEDADDQTDMPTEEERAHRLHSVHLDRARRLHENHQRGPDGRSCGLCVVSWPCPARTWADRALRAAQQVIP